MRQLVRSLTPFSVGLFGFFCFLLLTGVGVIVGALFGPVAAHTLMNAGLLVLAVLVAAGLLVPLCRGRWDR